MSVSPFRGHLEGALARRLLLVLGAMVLLAGSVQSRAGAQADEGVPLFFSCATYFTFDSDNQAWRAATTSDGSDVVLGPQPVGWAGAAGNPGGTLEDDDLDTNWSEVWTPELVANGYATDYSAFVGESFNFDYQNTTGIDYPVYVAIRGGGAAAYFVFEPQIADSTQWTTVVVPLVASEWVTGFDSGTGPTGAAPSDADFAALLGDVEHFAFSIEGQDGADTTRIDNVGQPCDPAPAMEMVKVGTPSVTPLVDGATVDYEFTVTNTGNVGLSDLTISDDKAGDVTCPTTDLAPLEQVVCEADEPYTVSAADVASGSVVNTATATALDPAGAPVTAEATSTLPVSAPAPAAQPAVQSPTYTG